MNDLTYDAIKFRLHCLSGILNIISMTSPNPIDDLVARFLISTRGQEILARGVFELFQTDQRERDGGLLER